MYMRENRTFISTSLFVSNVWSLCKYIVLTNVVYVLCGFVNVLEE